MNNDDNVYTRKILGCHLESIRILARVKQSFLLNKKYLIAFHKESKKKGLKMVVLVSKGWAIVVPSISQRKHLKDQLELMLCVGSGTIDVK